MELTEFHAGDYQYQQNSELKDKAIEIMQSEKYRERDLKEWGQSLGDCRNSKRYLKNV